MDRTGNRPSSLSPNTADRTPGLGRGSLPGLAGTVDLLFLGTGSLEDRALGTNHLEYLWTLAVDLNGESGMDFCGSGFILLRSRQLVLSTAFGFGGSPNK